MDTVKARRMALDLIEKYCPIYSFAFSTTAKSRLGVCKYRLKRIELNRFFVENNSEELVFETILHEIAHALTPGAGHGARWKRKAMELGIRPIRCADASDNVISPPKKYQFVCPKCGTEEGYYRKPRTIGACASCCRKYNYGKFSHDYEFVPMNDAAHQLVSNIKRQKRIKAGLETCDVEMNSLIRSKK